MAKREKGKIPHSEWDAIFSRYEEGESLASIARAYNCTAPAIRYIVKRGSEATLDAAKDREPVARTGAFPISGEMTATSQRRSEIVRPAQRLSRDALDPALREKISAEIAAFLVAFDSSLGAPSNHRLQDLRDATDSLMRAAARIRIELELLLAQKERPAA